jgi:hypothetical protein
MFIVYSLARRYLSALTETCSKQKAKNIFVAPVTGADMQGGFCVWHICASAVRGH